MVRQLVVLHFVLLVVRVKKLLFFSSVKQKPWDIEKNKVALNPSRGSQHSHKSLLPCHIIRPSKVLPILEDVGVMAILFFA